MKPLVIGIAAARLADLQKAKVLALITIFYNIAEGVVSVGFGLRDETIALFGFGVDSFVEVASGIGIWHMLRRIETGGSEFRDRFEQQALRITGTGFYLLCAGLVATAGVNQYLGRRPEDTFWGIVVSVVSIVTMWLLIRAKLAVGRRMASDAIIADANCTRVCLYLSIILLVSSAGYRLTGISGMDSLGALGIAWFSFSEGRESFLKAAGRTCSCSGNCRP